MCTCSHYDNCTSVHVFTQAITCVRVHMIIIMIIVHVYVLIHIIVITITV